MDRRSAIKRAALMLGYAVSASSAAAVLKGCKAAPQINWTPVYLSAEQANTISAAAERILPKTDTPGAIEVGVPEFIDLMLRDSLKLEEQTHFQEGLNAFMEDCQTTHGQAFESCTTKEQIDFLKKYEATAKAEEGKDQSDAPQPFFMALKEMTILGYLTSETIGENYLAYDPVPGGYVDCMPLSETDGKAWSL